MKRITHQLCVTGFDNKGQIGTVRDKDGKPLYNIDTSNLTNGDSIMSDNILAVDSVKLISSKYAVKAVNIGDAHGNIHQFDIIFSVASGDDSKPVATVRLNDVQANDLGNMLLERHISERQHEMIHKDSRA